MTRRVAIVAYSAPPYSAGGVASAHYNLFRAMQRAGADAHLFTFGDYRKPDEEGITRRGGPPWLLEFLRKVNGRFFDLIDGGKKGFQTVDILSSLMGSWRMGKEISLFSPDVVILSDHGAPGFMLKKKPGAKWVLVSHHNPRRFVGPKLFPSFSSKDVRWAIDLENRVLRKVDAVVCPSKYMKDWFEKSYLFSGEVYVIPNLLDETVLRIEPNPSLHSLLRIKPSDPVVYMPSVGSRLKGAEYALDIIHGLVSGLAVDIGFYIPGILESGFVEQLKSLPDRAHLYLSGQLPYAQHIANMKACSLGCAPSLMENYSMAILEAVCCGVPMLAFNTGGNAEIISDGNNGFLVEEGDVQGFYKQGQRLLAGNSLAQLQQRTIEYSGEHLSPINPLRNYLDLVESI